MHLINNLLDIELFDGSMKPIGPYGTGRLCFTNLVKKSTPMVRFLLDDLVTIKKSECGYGYRKSIFPHGRYELSVDINNRTLGNLDFEEIIYRYGLFMNYNVEIFQDKINITLEEYDETSMISCDISELMNEISRITGIGCSVNLVPLGKMTAYRQVRDAKSIVKVADRRKESRQEMPSTL
jgi:phenylacetate-CoA ligase